MLRDNSLLKSFDAEIHYCRMTHTDTDRYVNIIVALAQDAIGRVATLKIGWAGNLGPGQLKKTK